MILTVKFPGPHPGRPNSRYATQSGGVKVFNEYPKALHNGIPWGCDWCGPHRVTPSGPQGVTPHPKFSVKKFGIFLNLIF